MLQLHEQFQGSSTSIFLGLVVMISACHPRQVAGDRGSIPRERAFLLHLFVEFVVVVN
jgi:hypothetical protein